MMIRESNHRQIAHSGKSAQKGRDSGNPTGKFNRWLMAVTVVFAIAGLSFTGCSNSDTVSSGASGSQVDLGALNYFPVDVGYSASFRVTDANGAEIRRESYSADSIVYVNGNVGVNWVQRDLADSSVLSRGSMSWNSDRSVLYHAEDSSANVERLLRSPLSDGAQWQRWHDPSAPGNGGVDLGLGGGGTTGGAEPGADTSGNTTNSGVGNDNPFTNYDESNPQLSSFPTKGAQTFYVTSTTDNLTVNGKDYNKCLHIVNANLDETVNHYWYCQGVGLVKYALNAKPGSMTGAENGELLQ